MTIIDKQHGDGFEAGLSEHALFTVYVTELLQDSIPTVNEDSAEEYLNTERQRYLNDMLDELQPKHSDFRVGFAAGFQAAHESFIKILRSGWKREADGLYVERRV